MRCERCKKDFDPDKEPGALLFSAPLDWNGSMVTKKTHLCASCGYIVDCDIHRYRADPPRRYLNRL